MHTLAGAFSKAVIAVFAENVPVLFEEILCFIEDILDLLQQLKRCLIESSDTSLEGEHSPFGEDKHGPHVSSLFVKLLWPVSHLFSLSFSPSLHPWFVAESVLKLEDMSFIHRFI